MDEYGNIIPGMEYRLMSNGELSWIRRAFADLLPNISIRDVPQDNAADRAESLLLSMLDPRQRMTYNQHRFVEVIGSEGGYYRVWMTSPAGNVQLVHPGKILARPGAYCAHPPQVIPMADMILAQLLYLRTNEAGFLAVANPMGHSFYL